MLRLDDEMGKDASDGVYDNTSQGPAGAIAAGDFAPNGKFSGLAHGVFPFIGPRAKSIGLMPPVRRTVVLAPRCSRRSGGGALHRHHGHKHISDDMRNQGLEQRLVIACYHVGPVHLEGAFGLSSQGGWPRVVDVVS